ncbi:LacI family transcriptional regulator [bacterium]|nr:MAG: LacI family transcriptional regulator [bacterium]
MCTSICRSRAASARSRCQRTGILGLYLRWDQWTRPYGYFATVRWHLERALAARDLQMLVHNASYGLSAEEAYAHQAGGVVDGVLLLNSARDPIVERLLTSGLPTVEVGDPSGPLPFVACDGGAGVRLALAHLKERGYERPAYLGHVTQYDDAADRVEAFQSEAVRLFPDDRPLRRVAQVMTGAIGLGALLGMDPRPDAVICASDEMGYEVLQAALRQGLRVPEDLAVVGFDAQHALGAPQVLTSVATPLGEMAEEAVAKLLAIIAGEEPEARTILTPTLRVADTT